MVTSLIVQKTKLKKNTKTIPMPKIDNPVELNKIAKEALALADIEKTHGKIKDGYWVWPDGRKTHMRFVAKAVSKYKNLPLGFYKEALKQKSNNLNLLVAKAKHLGLLDNVETP